MDVEPNQDCTITVDPSRRSMPWLDTGMELLVIDAHGRESTWPICRALMQIGRAGTTQRPNDIILEGGDVAERQAMLQYRDGKVFFLNLNDACPATHAGKHVSFTEMVKDEDIALGIFRFRMVTHQHSLASLEGYSQPYMGRRWTLRDGPNPIGRPGKRDNVVVVEDVTVSRTHATISRKDGIFSIQPDTDSVPLFVNGLKIDATRALQDGDLVQLGQQIFRFRLAKNTAKGSSGEQVARPATILFADIWNYGALSENRPLDEFTRQVSEYYEMVDQRVNDHNGFLTTYLGDAIVAIFAAEESRPHAVRAVQAAMVIQREVDALNRTWLNSGLPPFGVGIGIHTGEVILEDLSLRGKSELAAVGEEARMAADIEKLTKQLDARILISHPTADALGITIASKSRGAFSLDADDPPVELFQVEF